MWFQKFFAPEGTDLKSLIVQEVTEAFNLQIGEPIDEQTRDMIVDDAFDRVGKIYFGDFRVECSYRNNPPDLVDRNGVAVRLIFFGETTQKSDELCGKVDITFDPTGGNQIPKAEWLSETRR